MPYTYGITYLLLQMLQKRETALAPDQNAHNHARESDLPAQQEDWEVVRALEFGRHGRRTLAV